MEVILCKAVITHIVLDIKSKKKKRKKNIKLKRCDKIKKGIISETSIINRVGDRTYIALKDISIYHARNIVT